MQSIQFWFDVADRIEWIVEHLKGEWWLDPSKEGITAKFLFGLSTDAVLFNLTFRSTDLTLHR